MPRFFLDSPLGQVHYVDTRTDIGAPILLLHQTPRSIDEFADIIPLLAPRHRAIALDTPGYGDSKPTLLPTIAEYAAIIPHLMDRLNLARVHLVGYHTGAILAIETAVSHPERVSKLGVRAALY